MEVESIPADQARIFFVTYRQDPMGAAEFSMTARGMEERQTYGLVLLG